MRQGDKKAQKPQNGVDKMKIENWKINTNKVRAWAENQEPCDNLTAVMLSLQLGDNCDNDDLRSTYWTAIRSIGSTMDGFPAARRGRESSLSEEQLQNVGIVELFTGIQSYLKLMEKSGDLNKKRLNRYKKRVRDLVRESLERSFWNSDKIQILDQLTKKLDQIKEAPHIVVKQLLKKT